jgi:hypothetical protein
MTVAVKLETVENKRKNMIKQKALMVVKFFIFFLLIINFSVNNIAHSFEFEIDEIITAIKNEIKTANLAELGSPNFKIDNVDVALTVVSTETDKGALVVKIFGYDNESDNEVLTSKSYHKLSFSFQPTGASGFSPEISLGLVEPIKKVKASLRKAYNTPPYFQMEGFTFKLEFAIEKNTEGGISFTVIELNDLKARNVTTHKITVHMQIQD